MSNPMSNPNKVSPNRVKCDVCDVWCPDNVSFQKHIEGKPHCKMLVKVSGMSEPAMTTNVASQGKKRKLEGTPSDFHCYTCNVNCLNTEQLQSHLKGSKHVKKLRLSDNNSQDNPYIETLNDGQGYRCNLCTVMLTSAVTIKSHLEGMKHMKKLQEKETSSPSERFFCKACNVFTNSASQLELHNSSSKHIKKLSMLNKAASPQKMDTDQYQYQKPDTDQYQSYDAWDPSS